MVRRTTHGSIGHLGSRSAVGSPPIDTCRPSGALGACLAIHHAFHAFRRVEHYPTPANLAIPNHGTGTCGVAFGRLAVGGVRQSWRPPGRVRDVAIQTRAKRDMLIPRLDIVDLFDAGALGRLHAALAASPVIVELRFRGSAYPPERTVFNHYAALVDYLRRVAHADDTITVWRYDAVCRPDNVLARSGQPGDADTG
jgi:hypothetical protein